MNRLTHGVWLAAAVALVGVGCGDLGTGDGGTTCSTDSSCGAGQMCHPLLRSCVPSCTGSGDCPSSAKTCATIDGQASGNDGGVLAFCQCSTDALCNGGSTGSLVCQDKASKTCEAKCTGNSSCPSNHTCDTATGKCSKGAGTDGGTDAGVSCSYDNACQGTQEVCNYATDKCEAAAQCTPGTPPETCGYSGYCAAYTPPACAQVAKPTCANFTPPGGKTPVFNPKTSTGPIIYYVEDDASPNTAVCFKGFFVHSFYLNVYRDTAWPSQLAAMPGAFYVTTDGTQQDITAGLPGSYYVPTGTTLRLRKYLCAKTQSGFTAGFFYTGGNETCATSAGGTAGTTNCTSNADCGAGGTCTTATGTCS